MHKSRFNFTKQALLNLPTPEKDVATYHDTTKHGLKLLVRPSGIKTFVLYRKVLKRPERITIGRFPDLTIAQAREHADRLNAKIANGINPNEEKRSIRNEMTLKALFDLYLNEYAKKHKKSWKEDEGQFNRYLKPWANKKLSSIKKTQIQKLHLKIGADNGHYAANRLLALLHTVFNKAIDWGWKEQNPAHGIKKHKERSRKRFLQADELPRFFQALAEEPNETARDYFLVSLLTGARRANVLAMKWAHINFDRQVWVIPNEETKTDEEYEIPLVQAALDLLEKRRKNLNPFVFPGTGKQGHFSDPKKAWKRILTKAGIENLRIHDLRRSLGSWQAATGANLSIIGKTLSHKNVSTTAIYAQLSIDPVREAMNKATDAMFATSQRSNKSEVIQLNSIPNEEKK